VSGGGSLREHSLNASWDGGRSCAPSMVREPTGQAPALTALMEARADAVPGVAAGKTQRPESEERKRQSHAALTA